MRRRSLLRSLLLAGALVAGALAGGSAGADPAGPMTPQVSSFVSMAGIVSDETDIAGGSVVTPIYNPTVASGESSGFILEVNQGAGRAVRVGWEVNPVKYPASPNQPHLLVERKITEAEGYSSAGFEQPPGGPGPYVPGDPLTADPSRARPFDILHLDRQGGWAIRFDAGFIGYFPDKLWNGAFTRSNGIKAVGFVPRGDSAWCADMGNGLFASNPESAYVKAFVALYYQGKQVGARLPGNDVGFVNDQSRYTVASVASDADGRKFRYGGPSTC